MLTRRTSLTKKTFIILIAGLLIYVLFLVFFVDIDSIISAAQQAYLEVYLMAFIVAVGTIFFHSLTWWYLLQSLTIKTSLRKVLSFIWIGNLVDILVPAESISGEVMRGYLMSRELAGNTGAITASIISHRLIYTAISLVGFVIGSTVFTLRHNVPPSVLGLIIIITVLAAASLILLCLLCVKREIAWKLLDSLIVLLDRILRGRLHLSQLKPKIVRNLDAFYESMNTLSGHPSELSRPIVFSFGAWISKLIITYLVFLSLGIDVSLSSIVVVFSLIDTLQTIPIGIPGEVGVIEIVMTGLYVAIGVPLSISATATILIRIVTMWFILIVGIVLLQFTILPNESENYNDA